MAIAVGGPALLDINTQRDLLYPDGAYQLHQAPELAEPLRKVFAWAARARCPVVSTRLRNQVMPAQRKAQPICVPNTEGYRKVPFSILRRRAKMPIDCGTSLPVEGFRRTQQFIFDLPGLNPFECPRLDRLLTETETEMWVVVGGPLEWTLRMAVLGLLQRRHQVAIVRDAIGQRDPYEGEMAIRQVESKPILWLTADELAARFTKKAASAPSTVHRHSRPIRPPTETPARTRKARRLRIKQGQQVRMG